ncbi:MAG: hypothetical protein RIR79_12 [Pseudomonadota bacterium]|jgi:carboxyl-terminal processing protease
MWQQLKTVVWFSFCVALGMWASYYGYEYESDTELEPSSRSMERVSQTVRSLTTVFHVFTHYPEELFQLITVFNLLKNEYADSVSNKQLIDGAISGMVNHLEPHSYYLGPKEFKKFKGTPNRMMGTGIKLEKVEDGWLKIGEIVENSPARRAGLQPEDLITHVGGISVQWQTYSHVIQQLRSTSKSGLRLTVFRKKEHRTFTVVMNREDIRWPQVRTKWIAPGFAWVYINDFDEGMVKDFTQKMNALYKENPHPQGLVLDLRGNPGGLVSSAITLSSAFLPENTVVMRTKGRAWGSNRTLKTSRQRFPVILQTVPMVVLVNEGSASASEVVAGALQDYQRATLMGNTTFGKGLVQTFYGLGAGTGFQFTVERYYLPSGRSIQAKGLVPDVLLDETEKGNFYSLLQVYESELHNHLPNDQDVEKKSPAEVIADKAQQQARQLVREKILARLEEEEQKPLIKRKLINPLVGSSDDFQLIQALNYLKGLPVIRGKKTKNKK